MKIKKGILDHFHRQKAIHEYNEEENDDRAIMVGVNSLDTIVNHSSIFKNTEILLSFLVKKGFEYKDIYHAKTVIMYDFKKCIILKDKSKKWDRAIVSKNNKKIKPLFFQKTIDDFCDL